jgi:integrase
MPYANNTAFARQMRAYIADKRRRLPKVTVDQYERWFKQFGERLDWKDPKEITVRQLESLEAEMMSTFSESTVAVRMPMLRDMLICAGNKDARRYDPLCTMQPAKDSVFLSEEQMAKCRLAARRMGDLHELLFSLMVDNGLRPVDVMRLSVSNARELLDSGESMIVGKGRNGGKLARLVLSPMTVAPMKRYLVLRRTFPSANARTELVLSSYNGMTRPASRQFIYVRMKDVFEAVGLEAKPRDLRKTCGNRVYKLTKDVAMSAMILRHSNPGTTFRHYIGADSVEMKAVQARLAGLNPDRICQESV